MEILHVIGKKGRIAINGILIALLLSAVQAAREATRLLLSALVGGLVIVGWRRGR